MLDWRLVTRIAVAVGMSAAAPHAARAELIDLGSVTRDTTAELDWLDLTETVGLSYDDVVNGVGNSWYAEGWRYATVGEVCDLVSNYVAPFEGGCPGAAETAFGDLLTPFQALFGVTRISGLGEPISQGLFEDEEPADPAQGLAVLWLQAGNSLREVHLDAVAVGAGDAEVGSFLVRPIPEPGSGALLLAGLSALCAAGRLCGHRPDVLSSPRSNRGSRPCWETSSRRRTWS